MYKMHSKRMWIRGKYATSSILPTIYTDYWDKENTCMTNLGLGGPFHTNFWITGVKADGK